ncbi:MAG TPA: ATP-binding protein [Chloroflexia bacterium]|nr:ATP-binding protein [Chloroflexia bacterium]
MINRVAVAMADLSRLFSQDNTFSSLKEVEALTPLQEMAVLSGPLFWDLLEGVFNNLSQGVIVADDTGRVVVFNRAAQQIMGYTSDEVVGKLSLWDFCGDCPTPPLFRNSLLQGQSFPEEEVEMSGKDDRNHPIGVKVTPLYNQQQILVGALASLRSLEEIRAQERERKSLVRLASIGRIISAVAHEINNPLQAVRTSLELGLDSRKSPQRRQEYLQAADQEILRIARIINRMRDFYRPNPAEKHPTDVNATLQDALNLLDKQISNLQVKVQLELAGNLPAVSMINYQLQQVFLNLILNALDSMPKGGHLTIRSQSGADNDVLVSFHDTGCKLDPGHAANLFDPFASNGRQGDLALGLSVSREIITELGGSVEIQPGEGNTLLVRLPRE